MKVENLRSPYDKVRGLYNFGRMLDKIRLRAAGKLPPDYVPNCGAHNDGKTCAFLRINYDALVQRVVEGGSDVEIADWCFSHGRKPTDEEIEMWNEYMRKVGWRDQSSKRIQQRKKESGFGDRDDIQTSFDYIELDEGRDPKERNAKFSA
jgi:gluconokinase